MNERIIYFVSSLKILEMNRAQDLNCKVFTIYEYFQSCGIQKLNIFLCSKTQIKK